jgi:alpha/beta superfamily hydrolase
MTLTLAVTMAHGRVPRVLIDIPGVGWYGAELSSGWGELLDQNQVMVYVRHQGPGADEWVTPPGVQVVTLSNQWDRAEAERTLAPVLEQAYAGGRDVHVVVDMNISFARHTFGTPLLAKKGEDAWAGAVTDFVAGAKPQGCEAVLAEHSRGTLASAYVTDFRPFSHVIVSSPRGSGLEFLDREDVTCPVDVITGVWDAPALRWPVSSEDLVSEHPNVRVLRLRDVGWPGTVHGWVQNVSREGTWQVIGSGGTGCRKGTLEQLLSSGGAGGSDATEPVTDPGGVDFSSVNIRYFAEQEDGSVDAVFCAHRAGPESAIDPVEADWLTWNSFCTWLALPNNTFWVNLNPTEPDQVVNPELGRTDAGRIMLEADLRLKRDLAHLTHPHDSELGRQFWDRLYEHILAEQGRPAFGQRIAVPVSYRVWIVPGRVSVRSSPTDVFVEEALLGVQLESDYLKLGKIAGARVVSDRSGIQAFGEQLLRSSILPVLTEMVNTAPQYRELRQIFHSRVVAEWYKTRHEPAAPAFSRALDAGDTRAWRSQQQWTPSDVFRRYVESLSKGEYSFTEESETVQDNAIIKTLRSYFTGGVDFTKVVLTGAGGGRGGGGGSGGGRPGHRDHGGHGHGHVHRDSTLQSDTLAAPPDTNHRDRLALALLLPSGYWEGDGAWLGSTYDAAALERGRPDSKPELKPDR